MSIFEQFADDKRTISGALGKALAREAIDGGRTGILTECVDLASCAPLRQWRSPRHPGVVSAPGG